MNEINLRPLSLGELLDKAIRIYRSRFFLYLSISALLELPSALISTVAILRKDSFSNPNFFIAPFFTAVAFIVLTPIMAQTYLRQPNPIQPRASEYHTVLFSVVAVTFLISLLGIFLSSQLRNAIVPIDNLSMVPLYFLYADYLSIVFYIILVARWRMTRTISILESRGAVSAMRRSWALTRGWFWRIFSIFCILTVLTSILSRVLTAIAVVFVSFLSSQSPDYQMVIPTQIIVPALINILILPLYVSIDLAIYYDLRVRKEGLDLQLRADALS